jgi:hypothetical protein
MPNPFVGYDNVIMLLEPQDIGSTANAGIYMDLRNAQKAFFLVITGDIGSASAADEFVITIEAATAEGGTEAQVDFRYRKSGALGDNTWGAVTTVAAATGLGLGADDSDDVMVMIEVDPDALAANDYRFVRLVLDDNTDMTTCLIAVLGIIEARYKQTTHISATASASS